MAEFLGTQGINYRLEQVINNANERLILISPYLKINDHIKNSLVERDMRKIDIRLIYGKSELQPLENNWLKSLQYVRTSFLKDLHAKCYLNEKEAIVTSMNLYDFSQITNYEMGIYVEKDKDPTLYDNIYEEVKRLIIASGEIKVTVSTVPSTPLPRPKSTQTKTRNGYCIRCHTEVKLNPMVPYCKKCYSSWNEYKNDEFEEKCCHICGKQNKSTKIKPSCYDCYTKHKDKLEFPLVK